MMTGQQKFTEDAMIDCILLNDLIMNRTASARVWQVEHYQGSRIMYLYK